MNNSRPFDLSRLDFEKIRKTKRRRLLLFSLPLCLVFSIVGLKFISLSAFTALAHSNYDSSHFSASHSWLTPLTFANWIQPYTVHYNQGNALFKQANYSESEKSYRTALETVPSDKECSVRINLALSIESQADALTVAKKYDAAIIKYDAAKSVLYDGQDTCGVQFTNKAKQTTTDESSSSKTSGDTYTSTTSDSSKETGVNTSSSASSDQKSSSGTADKAATGQQAKNLEQRLTEKSSAAKQLRNNDATNATPSNGKSSDELTTMQEKIDKLEKISDTAQKQRTQTQHMKQESQDYDKLDLTDTSKRQW